MQRRQVQNRVAQELRELSHQWVGLSPDPDLRALYTKKLKPESKNNDFFHLALFSAMAVAAECEDQKLVQELAEGMYITGPVAKSDVWPSVDNPKPAVIIDEWDASAEQE